MTNAGHVQAAADQNARRIAAIVQALDKAITAHVWTPLPPKFSEMPEVGLIRPRFTDWTRDLVLRWQWRECGQLTPEDFSNPVTQYNPCLQPDSCG